MITSLGHVLRVAAHRVEQKAPRAIPFDDQVPITPTGKFLRRLLSDLDDGTRVMH